MVRIVLSVTIHCRLFPTEDPRKVADAIRMLFPDAEIEIHEDRIIGKTDNIDHLLDVIGREEIAPRALAVMKRGKKRSRLSFPLSREAATVGKISFGEEGEFPPIWVEVEGDVEEIFDRLRSLAGSE